MVRSNSAASSLRILADLMDFMLNFQGMNLNRFFDRVLDESSLQRALLAIGVAIATGGILFSLRWLLKRRAHRQAGSQEAVLPRLVRRIPKLTLVVFSLYAGVQVLDLPSKAELRIHEFAMLIALVQAGIWISFGLEIWFGVAVGVDADGRPDPHRATAVRAVSFVAKLSLWTGLSLAILANFGINVTALVAGLGVGGIAVALAVQNVLGDLLASLSIILDKPFVVGDALTVDGTWSGSVESVGVKTTRLRSSNGEQLIFGNADLLKSKIQNFRRMEERRVVVPFSVSYDTPTGKLDRIPEVLKAIIGSQAQARFERAYFKVFSPTAMELECSYWVKVRDFQTHSEILNRVLVRVASDFEREGIKLSQPATPVVQVVQKTI